MASIAEMIVEDRLENTGPTVALNVLSWEDVNSYGYRLDILHGQKKTSRILVMPTGNPQQVLITGDTMFPHDPKTQYSRMGPLMSTIEKFKIHSSDKLNGTAAFVICWLRLLQIIL